jgi:hypothetical protein
MAKSEHDYSKGQRLRALLTSFQMGITMKHVLNQWEPSNDDPMDATANDLQHQLVEAIYQYRQNIVAEHRAAQAAKP